MFMGGCGGGGKGRVGVLGGRRKKAVERECGWVRKV